MKDEEFQKLLDAPGPVIIYGNRRKITLSLVGLLCVSAVCLKIGGIILSGMCGFFAVFFVYKLLFPQSESLKLNNEGFHVSCILSVNNKEFYKWSDVSQFKTENNNIISFSSKAVDYKDYSISNPHPKFSQAMVGYTDSIKNRYDLSNHQLAQLLNHWRERSIQAK